MTQAIGMIGIALCVAVVLVTTNTRWRRRAMVFAAILTPLLLVVEIWNTSPLVYLRAHPALLVAGVVAGAVLLVGLALLLRKYPQLFALLAVGALPFRLPVELGDTTANLLLPLYLVIGSGVLATILRRDQASANGDTNADPSTEDENSEISSVAKKHQQSRRVEQLLAVAVVVYALQATYSLDSEKALTQMVFFYAPFGLMFALLRDLKWTPQLVKRCFAVLAGLALVFVAIGFWEYFMRESLLSPRITDATQFQDYFRVSSLFFDPNMFGRFLVLPILAFAAILLWAERTNAMRDEGPQLAERGVSSILPKKLRRFASNRVDRLTFALIVAGLAVLWCGLFLTLSQSSFSALLAGLGLLAALRFNTRWIVGTVGAVVLVLLLVTLVFPGEFGIKLDSRRAIDKATSGRVELVEGGIALAESRPLGGYGSGSFSEAYREQQRDEQTRAVTASHTIPITVAAEQGLIGLALYIALLVAALVRLLRRASRSPARAAIAAAFVAVVIHTWTYAAFLEDPCTWALLGVGCALANLEKPILVRRIRAKKTPADTSTLHKAVH